MFYPNEKNFGLEELLPMEIIERFSKDGLRFLNPLALITLQQLRNRFGRMRVNSIKLGFDQRTIRTLKYYQNKAKREGAKDWEVRGARAYNAYQGMHKYGGAFDVDFLDTPLEEVIEYIKANHTEFPFIRFIEVDINWFHFDVRNQDTLQFWSPDNGVVLELECPPIDWSKLVDIEGKPYQKKS